MSQLPYSSLTLLAGSRRQSSRIIRLVLIAVVLIISMQALSGFAASEVSTATNASLIEESTIVAAPGTTLPDASLAVSVEKTLAAQLQPSNQALSNANQQLLTRNARLQREVNDLQTQTNVLVYESKGQLFLYGAFTVLISLLVGIFISWLVFVRRERW